MATVITRIEGGCSTSNPDNINSSGESYSGNSIFTTTITERNVIDGQHHVRVRALEYHLERLLSSAQSRFQFSSAQLKQHPEHTVDRLRESLTQLVRSYFGSSEITCAKLRITVDEKGSTVLQEPWTPRWDLTRGISLATVTGLRPSPEIKNADTAFCCHAENEARRQGADEALLVSERGMVAEGAWSNFFWFDSEGNLVTPKTLLLPGVTRRIILEQEACEIRDASLSEILESASEAFVTQATHGIAPVVKIDTCTVGGSVPGPRTADLIVRFCEYQKQYDTIVPLTN